MQTEEEIALIKKARSLVKTIEQSVVSLKEVLIALRYEEEVVVVKMDANNEPRWEYQIPVELPSDFYLTKEMTEYPRKLTPWTLDTVVTHFVSFKEYYDRCRKKKNGKWSHWRKVWYKWVRTTYERETKGNGAKPSRFDRAAIRE